MTQQIANLQVIGRELAIAWSDGRETYVPLETLRRSCPCAVCKGEPDVLGRGDKPDVKYSAASFDLDSHQMVGGYGWQPKWADGHASGIFSVALLRQLDPATPRA